MNKEWNTYNHSDLQLRCQAIGKTTYVVEGLIPSESVNLLFGDSGVGKSPFLYQMSLCVAAGIPFLGHAVQPGKVIFLDFENGLIQVDEIISSLLEHLELKEAPDNLHLWNVNDFDFKRSPNAQMLGEMIEEIKPVLVIIDAITALYPRAEDKASQAIEMFNELRELRKQASICGVHHIRKPSDNSKVSPRYLEDADYKDWFLQVRGSRALINGCDVRLGVDVPRRKFKEAWDEKQSTLKEVPLARDRNVPSKA